MMYQRLCKVEQYTGTRQCGDVCPWSLGQRVWREERSSLDQNRNSRLGFSARGWKRERVK